MKTHIKQTLLLTCLALPAAFFMSFENEQVNASHCDSPAQSEKSPPPSTKVDVNICGNVVPALSIISEMVNFNSGVLDVDGNPLSGGAFKIAKAHLNTFENSIVNDHNSMVSNGTHSCSHFFPAFQAFYGLSGNKITLHYKKVCYCSNSNAYETEKDFAITYISNSYFTYNGTTFGANNVAATTQVNSYTADIKFKEPGSTTTRTFVVNSGAEGDATSVIIPFQVANTVMLKNNNSDELTLINIAVPSAGTTNKFRHSLAIGPKMTINNFTTKSIEDSQKNKKAFFTDNYAGNMADRSNLCPPSCTSARFTATTNLVCP